MAKVKFVFEGNSTIEVPAATDRGAKLMVTGVRKRMEAGEVLIEVKGAQGSIYINPDRLAFAQPQTSGSSKGTKRATSKKAARTPAKRKTGRGRR